MRPYRWPGTSVSDAFSSRSAPPPGLGSVNGPSSMGASREPAAAPEEDEEKEPDYIEYTDPSMTIYDIF